MLGIRVKLGAKAKEGDRVAIAGAWVLDDDHHWYWAVDTVTPLPPAAPSDIKDPPAPVPSHAVANGDLPGGARTISVAKDGDAVYFQLVGSPHVLSAIALALRTCGLPTSAGSSSVARRTGSGSASCASAPTSRRS